MAQRRCLPAQWILCRQVATLEAHHRHRPPVIQQLPLLQHRWLARQAVVRESTTVPAALEVAKAL